MTAPQDLAAAGEVVEQRGGVVDDAGGQDQALQGACREDGPGELFDGPDQTLAASQATADGLPLREEPGQLDRWDGLDLGSQGGQ